MQPRKDNDRFSRLAKGMAVAALAVVGLTGLAKAADGPFDWSVPNDVAPGYTPAPFLSDATASSVAAQFNAQLAADPNAVLAVKVNTPLLSSQARSIFDQYRVKYVFADFEDTTAVGFTRALADTVKASAKSGAAFIGNFNLYPVPNDPTRGGAPNTGAANSFKNIFKGNDYNASHATMANPAAYPGSPDFVYRNPNVGGPQFPNLRTAFFVLPIDRVTFTTNFLPPGQANIPWVARFNVWGNNFLNNASGISDGTNTYQYAFNTLDPTHPEYANQLPSAGDFSAQLLHERLRGAASYNLFNYQNPAASVIGYSAGQERSDALSGWNAAGNATLNGIFSRNNYKLANLVNAVPVAKSVSGSGILWSAYSGLMLSGVYDQSGAGRQLALLLSNMSNTAQQVDFYMQYGGASVNLSTLAGDPAVSGSQLYTIAPGTHKLLEFNLVGSQWQLFADDSIFVDNNRNGVGVPEPTSVALAGIGAAGLLLRRRSAKKA